MYGEIGFGLMAGQPYTKGQHVLLVVKYKVCKVYVGSLHASVVCRNV